jgi:hypothetical protein
MKSATILKMNNIDVEAAIKNVQTLLETDKALKAALDMLLLLELIASSVMHADETGINIDGKRHWLHTASNTSLTLLYPNEKRGREAMDSFGVIP